MCNNVCICEFEYKCSIKGYAPVDFCCPRCEGYEIKEEKVCCTASSKLEILKSLKP